MKHKRQGKMEDLTEDQTKEQIVKKINSLLQMVSLMCGVLGYHPIAMGCGKLSYFWAKNDDEDPDPYLAVQAETNMEGLEIPFQIGDLKDVAEHVAACTMLAQIQWGEAAFTAALDQAGKEAQEEYVRQKAAKQ